jgi:hypothetical protein
MPESWDSFQTSSLEDDSCEARGFIPRNRELSYDSYDEDYEPYMHQARRDWKQPEYFSMVTPEDEEEANKPRGKGRVESLKLISTNYVSPKRKHIGVDAGTYEETTAHTSTTKKVTLNTCISIKPMEEWEFKLNDEPAPPIKPLMRTKQRIRLENMKEINKVVEEMTDAMNSTRLDLQKALCRIYTLEESNRKIRAAVYNAIPPP